MTDLGTITLVSPQPIVYGHPVTFSWVFTKRPQYPTLGVFAKQGGGWAYIAELSVGRDLTGTASVVISNEMSSALPGTLDTTQPADAQAYCWDEYRGGKQPRPITGQVFFKVQP